MWHRKFILLMVLITFFLFCHFVWANPEGQSLSYRIGPLLNKTIQTSVEKAEIIKVIVVMNRDHLKPLSENLINELKKRVEMLGGHIGDHAFNNVQAWIPIDKVEELAKWEEIKLIKAPVRPQINSMTSEGRDVIGATSWHNSGLTGKGVKIGVIDTGFSGYSSLLGSELPSDTTAVYIGSTSDFYSIKHGTACAEIVHDIAPAAKIYLINVKDIDVDFHNAVSWLRSQNVNVISSSIGINLKIYCRLLYEALRTSTSSYYISSQINSFQNSVDQWNSTINSVINQETTWAQAAGNDGQKKWIGFFNDSDGDFYLNFSSYENYNEIKWPSYFPFGQDVYVVIVWGFDTDLSTYDDYDLYITDEFGFTIDSSRISQSQFPIGVEACKFTPIPGKKYHVWVSQYRAVPQEISLLIGIDNFANLKYTAPVGTVNLFPPASNPNVITVGAVPYYNPYQIEDFSSRGPAANGVFKPDLVAPDRVSTVSNGVFEGTSAAAPHVAGAAALVLQAHPDWGPAQIKAALEMSALDIGIPGQDYDSGVGLLKMDMLLETLSQPTDLTGFWWNPARDGSGISIERRGNIDFLSWYTYFCNAPGDSTWLTTGGYSYSSMIGPFELDIWSGWPLGETPGYFEPISIGNVALLFRGNEDAILRVTDPKTNEVLTTWDLERFYFGPSTGDSRNGWWWDPAQAGNGVFIEFQGDQLFAAWYNYRSDYSGRWWTLYKYGFSENGSEPLPITEWTGGACFYSQQVLPISNQVGEATLTFQDDWHSTLNWWAEGQSGTYQLQRFLFEN